MKSIMNLFISILPILVLFALFSPVKPNAAFIANLCGKTEQPQICTDCLNSGPGSQSADGRGLALIAIRCAERDTREMAQKLGNLVRSTPESTLKTILNDCWISTGSAAGDFPAIERDVSAGNYNGGKNLLDLASMDVNSCLNNFQKFPTIPVPSAVLAGTVAATQGCGIASVILSNI